MPHSYHATPFSIIDRPQSTDEAESTSEHTLPALLGLENSRLFPKTAGVETPREDFYFGSFNRVMKIDPVLFRVWGRAIRRVEPIAKTRLLMHSAGEEVMRLLRYEFEALGVPAQR